MLVSFIIPVFHGEQTITKLFDEIQNACQKYTYEYEVIFIWDCGPDQSWTKIVQLKESYPDKIKGIKLSRNFGQHNAIICGFSYAIGDLVITMDEDLQHSPFDVKKMIDLLLEKDFDVVYGNYYERKHNGFRNITSGLLKKILEIGIPELHQDYSAYRVLKRNIALATLEMQNSYTFLDGYISWITTNVGSVDVSHNSRQGGKSSYTFRKLLKHSINIFVTFSNLPIKIVSLLSFFFFLFTSSYAAFVLIQKLIFNNLVPGFATMIVLIGFGIGSVLLGISILGEYIHRINLKTTKRPNYNISKIL